MDKTVKALFAISFVLAAALGFTTGLLLEEGPLIPFKSPFKGDDNATAIINKGSSNKTTSNPGNTSTEPEKEWNVSFCPICGAPFKATVYDPYLIDENGILHRRYYRIYECGHKIYMGEKTSPVYAMPPMAQETWREAVMEHGGEVYY